MIRTFAFLALVALAAANGAPNLVDQSISIKQVGEGPVINTNIATQDGRILAGQGNLIQQRIFADVQGRVINVPAMPVGPTAAAKKMKTRNLLVDLPAPVRPDIKVNPNVAVQVQPSIRNGVDLNIRAVPQVGVALNGRVDQKSTGIQYIAPNPGPGGTRNIITGSQVGVALEGNVRQRLNTEQRIEGRRR